MLRIKKEVININIVVKKAYLALNIDLQEGEDGPGSLT